MEKIIIGSDHGGYELKEEIKTYLTEHEYEDVGCYSEESVDYPDYASRVCEQVVKDNYRGMLICGTGIGMSIAANRVKGIRAALCYDADTAKMSRLHNNANILCLGGRTLDKEQAKRITKIWLETPFSGKERHIRRLNKIDFTI